MRLTRWVLVIGAGMLSVVGARADSLNVASSTSYALGSGQTKLNCGTLTVGGTLRGQAGSATGLANVQILGSGLVQGDGATFNVSGTWNNAGTFEAGSSTVRMTNACTSALTIGGNNRFCVLEVDAPGATLTLPSGTTWAACKLVLRGAPGAPLNIVTTSRSAQLCGPDGGIEESNVTYNGQSVKVSNCVPQVPVGGPWVLALMVLGLAGIGAAWLRRRAG